MQRGFNDRLSIISIVKRRQRRDSLAGWPCRFVIRGRHAPLVERQVRQRSRSLKLELSVEGACAWITLVVGDRREQQIHNVQC
jgi:hypothetical protein